MKNYLQGNFGKLFVITAILALATVGLQAEGPNHAEAEKAAQEARVEADRELATLKGETVQKWEYKTVTTPLITMSDTYFTSEYGFQGWELVAMVKVGDQFVYVFKRKF